MTKLVRCLSRFFLFLLIFSTLLLSFSSSFAAAGQNWTRTTDSPGWAPRHHFGSVVFNNKMWVLGGRISGDFKKDVWSSTDGITWTDVVQVADPHWSPRSHFGTVVFGGKMWVMGGYDAVGEDYVNDVWSSSDGVTWTEETGAALWPAGGYFGAVVYSGQIWVMGGWDGADELGTVYFL